jgi:hypothetical protein
VKKLNYISTDFRDKVEVILHLVVREQNVNIIALT